MEEKMNSTNIIENDPEVQKAFQKVYNSMNKTRKMLLPVSAVLAIPFFISGYSSFMGSVEESGFEYIIAGCIAGFMFSLFGFGLLGLHHMSHYFKVLCKNCPILFIPIALLFLFAVSVVIGLLFAIADVIQLATKKDLVYSFEHKHIFEKYEVRSVVERKMREAMMKENAITSVTANNTDSLRELKEMFDSNLITEEEYDNKKAELLNRM